MGGLHWSTSTDNVPPSWDGRTNLLSTNDRGSQLITNLIKDGGKYERRRKGDAEEPRRSRVGGDKRGGEEARGEESGVRCTGTRRNKKRRGVKKRAMGRLLEHGIRGGKMKGSGLTEDRRKKGQERWPEEGGRRLKTLSKEIK